MSQQRPLLGILVLDLKQEPYYFSQLAKVSSNYQMNVALIQLEQINQTTKTCHALLFEPLLDQWMEKTDIALPTIMYDRCFYTPDNSYKKYESVIRWLRNEVPFLGIGLPNKWEVQQALKKNRALTSFLIDTHIIESVDHIETLLSMYGKVLFKPLNGAQGRGIFTLEYSKQTYTIHLQYPSKLIRHHTTNKKGLYSWLFGQLEKHSYLCQPYLSLQQYGTPFDLRILMQKGSNGLWQERGRGIRVGRADTIASNLHQGGRTMNYLAWLSSLPPRKKEAIEQQVGKIIQAVPISLEEKFGRLFELGIDIGIDNNHRVWLLEVNSKPGRKVVLQTHEKDLDSLYEAPFQYSHYLIEHQLLQKNTIHSCKGDDC